MALPAIAVSARSNHQVVARERVPVDAGLFQRIDRCRPNTAMDILSEWHQLQVLDIDTPTIPAEMIECHAAPGLQWSTL
jgi:hypothetical protein